MINFIKQYKNIFIIALVVIALFIAYSLFLKPGSDNPLTAQVGSPTKGAVEQDLIALLLELRSIRLDTAVFEDPSFQSLKDFGQEIVSEPIGKNNPFAPLDTN